MGFLSRFSHRIVSHKAEAMTLHAGDLVDVVGESYRQDALRRVASVATDSAPYLGELTGDALDAAKNDRKRRWFRAVLIPEPDNKHDPNAIAVYADGAGVVGQLSGKVGYLSRDDAIEYEEVFEVLNARGCAFAACPAFLTGGTKSAPTYGAVLCLSTPERVVADLAES